MGQRQEEKCRFAGPEDVDVFGHVEHRPVVAVGDDTALWWSSGSRGVNERDDVVFFNRVWFVAVDGVRDLVSNDYYWMREHRVTSGSSPLADTPGPNILSVTRGSVSVDGLVLPRGTTAIVPASSSVAAFEGTDAVVMEMGV